jgi:hypothetical protein
MAGALALVVMLTACVGTPSSNSSSETSVSRTAAVPLFENRADALKAAEDVYLRYLKIGQQVSEDGGSGVDRFKAVLTGDAYDEERRGAEVLQQKKLVSTGATRLTAFEVQSADLQSGAVRAYACIDLKDVRVRTASGRDVTPAKRPRKQMVQPTFVWAAGRLMLKENGTWSGSSIC